MYKTILVPLDGSKRAEVILPHVEQLARRYDARVLLLQVEEEISKLYYQENFDVSKYQRKHNRQRKEAETYLTGIQRKLRENGIEVKKLILSGSVVQAILSIATREDIDLVAMASHGRTGLARVFYGSVAAGALHSINRPLLIIRAQ